MRVAGLSLTSPSTHPDTPSRVVSLRQGPETCAVSGVWVLGFGLWVLGLGSRDYGLGFRVWGLGNEGLVLELWGFGFRD